VSKGGSSQTTSEKQIPAWLSKALKPLLSQSATGLAKFGAQGQNILQGFDPGKIAGPIDPNAVVPQAGGSYGGGKSAMGPLEIAAMRNRVG